MPVCSYQSYAMLFDCNGCQQAGDHNLNHNTAKITALYQTGISIPV